MIPIRICVLDPGATKTSPPANIIFLNISTHSKYQHDGVYAPYKVPNVAKTSGSANRSRRERNSRYVAIGMPMTKPTVQINAPNAAYI